MNLKQIPKGEVVLLDANIVLLVLRGASVQCEQLLRRCVEREVSCIIPSVQFGEVMHRLMIAEARDNGWISGPNLARQLSDKPDRIRSLYRYEQAMRSLLGMGVALEPVGREDYLTAISLQRQNGFTTNDALMIACAERLRVQAIASADRNLASARGIILYSPDDAEE